MDKTPTSASQICWPSSGIAPGKRCQLHCASTASHMPDSTLKGRASHFPQAQSCAADLPDHKLAKTAGPGGSELKSQPRSTERTTSRIGGGCSWGWRIDALADKWLENGGGAVESTGRRRLHGHGVQCPCASWHSGNAGTHGLGMGGLRGTGKHCCPAASVAAARIPSKSSRCRTSLTTHLDSNGRHHRLSAVS